MIGAAAHFLTLGLIVYGTAGIVVAFTFLAFGLDRLDAGAHGRIAFRPLLVPGLALLWPLALARWRAPTPQGAVRQRRQRALHGRIWIGLSVLLPAILIGGLAIRQDRSAGPPPLRLSAPAP